MDPKAIRTTFGTLAAAALLSTGAALSDGNAAGAGSSVAELQVTIREWDTPTKGAHPHDPAVGNDGSLWFTEQMINRLGRLDPKSGNIREFVIEGDKNYGPHGLVADRQGNIWFTANSGGFIGKLDPHTGKVTQYKMPDKKAEDPHTAVFDSRGILWFTVQVGNFVGRLDPKNGSITLKAVPTAHALPYGILINSKGVPVFCEFGSNKIATIQPQTMEIKEYRLPEAVRPRRIALDRNDLIYFSDYAAGHLGRLDMGSGAVKLWNSPGGSQAHPYGIAVTPDGKVWYSESGVQPNTIVRFDPRTENFAVAKIPSGGGVVRNMAAAADGRVYIACSGVDKIGIIEAGK